LPKPLHAILLDGGFVTKKLRQRLARSVTADDVHAECRRWTGLPQVSEYELLRIYFYDAHPADNTITRPITGTDLELSKTARYIEAQKLHSRLELMPNMALRMGELALRRANWKLSARCTREIKRTPRPLRDEDFELDIGQKGVDLRIGLDMARLALRELVRTIIVVTADSDFVPAFKFVRREGVKVILDPMGQNPRVELKAHADLVLSLD
jgi:uncharacterized LabA/DUF88 family protein